MSDPERRTTTGRARDARVPRDSREAEPEPADALEAFRGRIRDAGLRVTAARLAVIAQLDEAGGPVSHADVAAKLASAGWDRATVYRNLTDLTEAGLVRRTDVGDHVWRFELLRSGRSGDKHVGPEHPHFMCDACGEVTCLPEETVRIRASRAAPRALRKKELEIQIKGKCDRCE